MSRRPSPLEGLLKIVRGNAAGYALAWFQKAASSGRNFNREAFVTAFASATRNLGDANVSIGPDLAERAPGAWDLATLGRIALLLTAAEALDGDASAALIYELYYRGDNREKQAVLRSLMLLPDPSRFTQLAADACRTSVQTVFEAIACENFFPSAHFDDLAFNQMVLKALFTGAPIDRIAGWKERLNGELVRMAGDYAAEREAAGRPVPPDILKILEQSRSER
jgi:hypothetical protein